jgi:hypothetical protein
MGAFATLNISRGKARSILIEKLINASDEELGNLLDSVISNRLYNCRIVPDDFENDDHEL